jgi:hypothetical protein
MQQKLIKQIRKGTKKQTTDQLIQNELVSWQRDLVALMREDADDAELREWVLWVISDLPVRQLSDKELRQCLRQEQPRPS